MHKTILLTVLLSMFGNPWGASATEGWLGVELQTLTDELRLALDLPEEGGALIHSVIESSPAETAGLERRDFIRRFDGTGVDGPRHLGRMVRSASPGDEVMVALIRDAEELAVPVTIGRRPEDEADRRDRTERRGFPFELLSGPRAKLGVLVVDLGIQMAEFLDAPDARGVLVLEVEEDSAAESAGLRAGDIVTAIDGEPVPHTGRLIDALRDATQGDVLRVTVIRRGEQWHTEVEIDEVEEQPSLWDELQRLMQSRRQRQLRCPAG